MSRAVSITRESVVSQSPGQLSASIEGEVVAMSLDGGKYYRIDEVGAAAWELMKMPIRVADLCSTLRESFNVDQKRCETDVIAFLDNLSAYGLLERGNQS